MGELGRRVRVSARYIEYAIVGRTKRTKVAERSFKLAAEFSQCTTVEANASAK